jgi:hypothetical protein
MAKTHGFTVCHPPVRGKFCLSVVYLTTDAMPSTNGKPAEGVAEGADRELDQHRLSIGGILVAEEGQTLKHPLIFSNVISIS